MLSGYTRHLAVTKPHPVYADHGEGCRVVDVYGRSTIDWINNFTCLIHGQRSTRSAPVQTGSLLGSDGPSAAMGH